MHKVCKCKLSVDYIPSNTPPEHKTACAPSSKLKQIHIGTVQPGSVSCRGASAASKCGYKQINSTLVSSGTPLWKKVVFGPDTQWRAGQTHRSAKLMS